MLLFFFLLLLLLRLLFFIPLLLLLLLLINFFAVAIPLAFILGVAAVVVCVIAFISCCSRTVPLGHRVYSSDILLLKSLKYPFTF